MLNTQNIIVGVIAAAVVSLVVMLIADAMSLSGFVPMFIASAITVIATMLFAGPAKASSASQAAADSDDVAIEETFTGSGDREKGTVKWFDGKKGYGFISRSNGEDVFAHFRSIRGRGRRFLVQGQTVEFSISSGDKGPQADDIMVVTG